MKNLMLGLFMLLATAMFGQATYTMTITTNTESIRSGGRYEAYRAYPFDAYGNPMLPYGANPTKYIWLECQTEDGKISALVMVDENAIPPVSTPAYRTGQQVTVRLNATPVGIPKNSTGGRKIWGVLL